MRRPTWTLIVAGCLGVAPAAAQQNVTPDGRLFDANPSIYGRDNGMRPATPLMRGNLIGSGNVRFGQSLRISSPVGDPSTFSGGLPSSGLGSFVRDSFSAADASIYTSRNSYVTPYFDASGTAPTAGFLRQYGAYGAGGSRFDARDPAARPTAIPGLLGAPRALDGPSPFAPVAPRLETDRSTPLDSSIFGPTVRLPGEVSLAVDSGYRSPRFGAAAGEVRRPGATLPDPGRAPTALDRSTFAEQVAGLDRVLPLDLSTPQQPVLDDWQLQRGVDVLAARSQVGLALDAQGTSLLDRRVADLRAADRAGAALAPVGPGQDRFTDMRLALELERDPSADWYAEMRQAQADASVQRSADLTAAYEAEAREFVSGVLGTPMRTYVSDSPTPLNEALRVAEDSMFQRRFYDASQAYERAAALDPANPLPLLGRANALLAAGEYRTAVVSLQGAIQRFPEITRFPADLNALLGSGETVDIRRADLMDLLARNEDPELRFLLGYVEWNSGQRERGLANLEKAAAQALPGSLIARYPDMLRAVPGAVAPGPTPASGPAQSGSPEAP